MMLASLEDRMQRCSDHYMITCSNFLDIRQRSLASAAMSHTSSGSDSHISLQADVRCAFYGGYPEAERTVAVFLPSYIEDDPDTHFAAVPEDNPLVLLSATAPKGSPKLSHRDYLGSLMGLGIRRDMTGDILVRENGADIIVLREIAEFIEMNLTRAGKASLSFEMLPLSRLQIPESNREIIRASVASLRLDSVVSSAFGLSRTKAHDAISAGIVYLDDLQVQKPEKMLTPPCKLVIRGRGKSILRSVEGTSAKGRTIISIERFR